MAGGVEQAVTWHILGCLWGIISAAQALISVTTISTDILELVSDLNTIETSKGLSSRSHSQDRDLTRRRYFIPKIEVEMAGSTRAFLSGPSTLMRYFQSFGVETSRNRYGSSAIALATNLSPRDASSSQSSSSLNLRRAVVKCWRKWSV